MSPRIADALRFWEQRRIAYNLLLTMVFVGWVVVSWPFLKGAFSLVHFAQLAVLALIANALYCGAYLAELFAKDLATSNANIADGAFGLSERCSPFWSKVIGSMIIAPLIH